MSQDKENNDDTVEPTEAFVDRDDEDSDGLPIDPQGEDPSPDREGSKPDPGYAAFADDFDDPLADWPGPDSSIDLEAEEERAAQQSELVPPDPASQAEDEPFSDELAFPEDDEDAPPSSVSPAVDSDEVTELDADEAEASTFTAATDTVPEYTDSDDLDDGDLDDEPWGDGEDDDIVDDFLADLDAADEDATDQDSAETAKAETAVVAAVAAHNAGTAAQGRTSDGGSYSDTARAIGEASDGGRRLPVLPIAVIVVALLLLGVGGYGVVQQRQAMEAEIRELQARLATTMSARESASAREQLRRLESENERLLADVGALQADNVQLRESLQRDRAADATEGVDAAAAAVEAAAETTAEPVGDVPEADPADSVAMAEPVGGGTTTASADGEQWFVNFGSYTRRLVAEQWAEQLEVADGEVIVQTASSGGRTVYRVRVIGLGSRDAAERVALNLERSFQLPRLWIGRQ